MRYKNQITVGSVVYKDSEIAGFTCVDITKTPSMAIYNVGYEVFTEGFNYLHYTTRTDRPAFINKGGKLFVLHVNDLGGWHLDLEPHNPQEQLSL